jgi:hypothetical protein
MLLLLVIPKPVIVSTGYTFFFTKQTFLWYIFYRIRFALEDTVMELTELESMYFSHQGLWNTIILVLVFGGMARVAFWREQDGLRVGGPLAIGLGLLLTLAALQWSREEGRRIAELGPLAAFVIVQAILTMCWAALRKSTRG